MAREKENQRTSSVDLAEMTRLLDFMNEHGLEEVEYARGDLRIKLRRAGSSRAGVLSATPQQPASANPGIAPQESAAEASSDELHIIKSPIVGTYYASPDPGSPPFIKLGDTVEAGQVLCIIEAMKLMNEIESDAAGQVVRMFVENGQPVEYGEPLFSIRPNRKK